MKRKTRPIGSNRHLTQGPGYEIFLGPLIQPLSDDEALFLPRGALGVYARGPRKGRIKFLGAEKDLPRSVTQDGIMNRVPGVMWPGMWDLHFHWVQTDVRRASKHSLLQWLQEETWPREAKYENLEHANSKAQEFLQLIYASGTVGGLVYGSSHFSSLQSAMERLPEEFLIGQVLMNMNSPDTLLQQTKQVKQEMQQAYQKFKQRYVVTPRFALTVDPELLKISGDLAKRHKLFVQTHLSETPQEVKATLELFQGVLKQKVKSYTDIYYRAGLLGPRTFLGHGIYLDKLEWDLILKTKSVLVHCPTSNDTLENFGLGSGRFSLETVLKNGVRWTLGSDIGGGPIFSMMDVMESFTQMHRPFQKKSLKIRTLGLSRSTLKSSEMLGQGRNFGNFQPGKWASFSVFPLKSGNLKNQSGEKFLESYFTSQNRSLLHKIEERQKWEGQALQTYSQGQCLFSL